MKISTFTEGIHLESSLEHDSQPKWITLQEKWINSEDRVSRTINLDSHTIKWTNGPISDQQAIWMELQAKWIAFEGIYLDDKEYTEYLHALADNGKMYPFFLFAVLLRFFRQNPPRKIIHPQNMKVFHVKMLNTILGGDQSLETKDLVPVFQMLNRVEILMRAMGYSEIGDFIASKHIHYRNKYLNPDIRVLGPSWTGPIGHLVTTSYFCAAHSAGLLPYNDLVASDGAQPSNMYFLSLFKDQFRVQFRETKAEEELETHGRHILENIDGLWVSNFVINREIEKRADPQCKGILKLSSKGDDALSIWRERVGIPDTREFVTVHIRTAGYRPNAAKLVDRDWDIMTLIPALKHLTSKGYAIVRMGDPSMPALPEIENVYDYALTDDKSDILDIALVARAAFHIGSSSGFSLVPMVFSTPSLFLNWSPRGSTTPWSARSWTVFKPFFGIESGERILNPKMLHELRHVVDEEVLKWKGIRRKDLSETQITAAVQKFESHSHSLRETKINANIQTPSFFESAINGTLLQTDSFGVPLTQKGEMLLKQTNTS